MAPQVARIIEYYAFLKASEDRKIRWWTREEYNDHFLIDAQNGKHGETIRACRPLTSWPRVPSSKYNKPPYARWMKTHLRDKVVVESSGLDLSTWFRNNEARASARTQLAPRWLLGSGAGAAITHCHTPSSPSTQSQALWAGPQPAPTGAEGAEQTAGP